MKELFNDADIPLSEADPVETFKLTNADGSGRISRKEFEDWIVSADPVATKLRNNKMVAYRIVSSYFHYTCSCFLSLSKLVGCSYLITDSILVLKRFNIFLYCQLCS